MNLLTLYDFVLAPLYIFVFYFIILRFSFPKLTCPDDRFFIKYGIISKVLGSWAALFIYIFYYNGGDTIGYLTGAMGLLDYLSLYPENLFDLLISKDLSDYSELNFIDYKNSNEYFNSNDTYFVIKVGFIFYLLALGSTLVTYFLTALFSFWASWHFYQFISDIYPQLRRPIGYAVFFMPSTIFWGSGLFKDTFTLAGFYMFFYTSYYVFYKRKFSFMNLFQLILSVFLLSSIRSFFLSATFPFVFIWIFFDYFNQIENKKFKILIFPFFLIFISGLGVITFSTLNDYILNLSIEKIEDSIKGFQSWHTFLGGSTYSLDFEDYSLATFIRNIPAGIIVTLFRPFIWEANKVVIMLSALQSLFFLLYTIRVVLSGYIYRFILEIFKSSEIFSLFFFSLFFAYVTGITSYNFGALDRYKIPCLSTYIIALIIIQYKIRNKYTRSS